jgi:hypothetical protein
MGYDKGGKKSYFIGFFTGLDGRMDGRMGQSGGLY